MFEFDDYASSTDPYNEHLKKLLTVTEVTRLGKDTPNYTTTAWGFLEGNEKGAPFSIQIGGKQAEKGELKGSSSQTKTKYISLNKVMVDVSGS